MNLKGRDCLIIHSTEFPIGKVYILTEDNKKISAVETNYYLDTFKEVPTNEK